MEKLLNIKQKLSLWKTLSWKPTQISLIPDKKSPHCELKLIVGTKRGFISLYPHLYLKRENFIPQKTASLTTHLITKNLNKKRELVLSQSQNFLLCKAISLSEHRNRPLIIAEPYLNFLRKSFSCWFRKDKPGSSLWGGWDPSRMLIEISGDAHSFYLLCIFCSLMKSRRVNINVNGFMD